MPGAAALSSNFGAVLEEVTEVTEGAAVNAGQLGSAPSPNTGRVLGTGGEQATRMKLGAICIRSPARPCKRLLGPLYSRITQIPVPPSEVGRKDGSLSDRVDDVRCPPSSSKAISKGKQPHWRSWNLSIGAIAEATYASPG